LNFVDNVATEKCNIWLEKHTKKITPILLENGNNNEINDCGGDVNVFKLVR